MICWELNWLFYDPSWMLQLSEFVWALCSSVWIVFNNFLLIDATDKSKISSDWKRLFFALRLYPLSFFANTPFNLKKTSWLKGPEHFSQALIFNPYIFGVWCVNLRYCKGIKSLLKTSISNPYIGAT